MVAQRIFTESHLPRFTKSTPSVDQVVNVDTFYRYLSILEEFCDLKRQLESKGREFADAYIQFSIARYIDFLRSASYKPDEPIPIDIAYVWHAHMLSPYRYYEDITYNIRDCKITVADAFPIYPLSEEYLKATSIPSKPISDLFVNHMTDPTKNTNTVTCRGCKDVLLHTWGESYEWRINPNVALECHNVTCTKRDNTLDDFALQELLNDLPRGIIKGNTLTPNGLVKSDLDDYKAIISGLYTHAGPSIKKAKTINEVTFLLRRSAGILADGTELDDVASDITKIIKSTYENNPSIFSLDLVQAVRRLDNFMDLAISKDDFRTPDGLVRSVRRYNDYLHLRKLKQHQDALPSLDVDIAWHVHMLHPNNYRHTMEAFLGHIPDHDSNIGPSDLDDLLVSTRRGWEKIWRAQILQASAKDGRGIAAALKKTTKLDKLKIPGGNKPATHPENKYNSITNDHDDSLRYVAGMYELPEDLNPSAFDRLAVPVVSYHNWRTTRKYIVGGIPVSQTVPKETVNRNQEMILREIKNTGYGYIGTVSHNVRRCPYKEPKRIKAVPVIPRAPPLPLMPSAGRIGPGSTIYEIDFRAYSSRSGYTGRWGSKSGGTMYRKYSRKHHEYGWTSDGMDWYSEEECMFVHPNYGEFRGLYFIRTKPLEPSPEDSRRGSKVSWSDRSGRGLVSF